MRTRIESRVFQTRIRPFFCLGGTRTRTLTGTGRTSRGLRRFLDGAAESAAARLREERPVRLERVRLARRRRHEPAVVETKAVSSGGFEPKPLGFAHARLFQPDPRAVLGVPSPRRARDILVLGESLRLSVFVFESLRISRPFVASVVRELGTLAREVSLLAAPETPGVARCFLLRAVPSKPAPQMRAVVRDVPADGVHQAGHRAPPVAHHLRKGLALFQGALLGAAERLQAPARASVADAPRRARGEQSVGRRREMTLRVRLTLLGSRLVSLEPVAPVRPVRVELALGSHRRGALGRLLARALRRRSGVASLRGILPERRPGGHPGLAGARGARRGGRARGFQGNTIAAGGVSEVRRRPLASVPVVVRGVIGRRPAATAVAFFGILPLLLLLLLVPLLIPLGLPSQLPLGVRLAHDGHPGQHRGARGPNARVRVQAPTRLPLNDYNFAKRPSPPRNLTCSLLSWTSTLRSERARSSGGTDAHDGGGRRR